MPPNIKPTCGTRDRASVLAYKSQNLAYCCILTLIYLAPRPSDGILQTKKNLPCSLRAILTRGAVYCIAGSSQMKPGLKRSTAEKNNAKHQGMYALLLYKAETRLLSNQPFAQHVKYIASNPLHALKPQHATAFYLGLD